MLEDYGIRESLTVHKENPVCAMGGQRYRFLTDFRPHSLAKTTLTSMLDRMEQGGLVKRRHNPENRREILVSDHARSPAPAQRIMTLSHSRSMKYYRGFTENEIQQHETYLARILANLEEYETLNGRKTT